MNTPTSSTASDMANELGQATRQGARALDEGLRDGAAQARQAVRDAGRHLGDGLDRALAQVQRDPVRAALWAALAGGVLATVLGCLLRGRR
jgi:hypothetical protein